MFLLLALIYLIFISLGLPDSLFGAAWPVMHVDFNVNESFASIYMIITAVGSGGVSFIAGPLIRKFGTGKVTVVSILLTAVGMLVIGFSVHIAMAICGSILMGFGAGAIDTGLNNYVSTHYKARHMNWLHAFWGVGVTLSPIIMGAFLDRNNNWRGGYRCVSCIQFAIFAASLFSLPLFKKYEHSVTVETLDGAAPDESKEENENTTKEQAEEDGEKPKKKKPAIFEILKIKGVAWSVLSLGIYTSMEFLIGTWGASYAVNTKGVSPADAARWVSLYFGGIMAGRVISGFISYKFDDKVLVGLLLIGTGFGPVFPSTIHAVPFRFGTKYSADITGIQMGGSYAIGWAVQLTFGFVAQKVGFLFMPYLLLAFAAALLIVSEITNKVTAKHKVAAEQIS